MVLLGPRDRKLLDAFFQFTDAHLNRDIGALMVLACRGICFPVLLSDGAP